MSCRPFKSSEANAKAFLKTKGAIDKYLNILDLPLFRQLNKKLKEQAKRKYFFNFPSFNEMLFFENNSGTKAIPNKSVFNEIDKMNGVYVKDEDKNYAIKSMEESKVEKIKEAIKNERTFIDVIGIDSTYYLAQNIFNKVVKGLLEGKTYESIMQEELDYFSTYKEMIEEYDLYKEDYTKEEQEIIENQIKRYKAVADNWDIIEKLVENFAANTNGISIKKPEKKKKEVEPAPDTKSEDMPDEDTEVNEDDIEIELSTDVTEEEDIVDGEENEGDLEVEKARGEVYSKETYEIDHKIKVSAALKLFLSDIKEIDDDYLNMLRKRFTEKYGKRYTAATAKQLMAFIEEDEDIYNQTWYGDYMRIPFAQAYKTIVEELKDSNEDIDEIIRTLSSSKTLWMPQVVEKLKTASEQIQNQFATEMVRKSLDMQYVQLTSYNKTIYVNGKKSVVKMYRTVVRKTNESQLSKSILKNWESNFKNTKILKSDGKNDYIINIPYFKNIKAKYYDNFSSTPDVNKADYIKKEYEELGIYLNDVTLENSSLSELHYIFQKTIKAIEGYSKIEIDGKPYKYYENGMAVINTNIITSVAKLEAKHSPLANINPDNVRTQGKQVYVYTLKNFLHDRSKELTKVGSKTLQNLRKSHFSKDSFVLSQLNEIAGQIPQGLRSIKDFDLQMLKTLEGRDFSYGDQRFTRINTTNQELATLALYVNSNKQYVTEGEVGKEVTFRLANYVFPTFSDKTGAASVELPAYKIGYENNSITDDVVEMLFNRVIMPEVKRIYYYYKNNSEKANYKEFSFGGKFFYFFPELNNIMVNVGNEQLLLSNAIKKQFELYEKQPENTLLSIENGLSIGNAKQLIKDKIKELVNNQIENKLESWKKSRILENTETSKKLLLDYTYLNKNFGLNDTTNFDLILDAARKFAAEYKVNDIIAKAEMHFLFLGDPASMAKKSKNFSQIIQALESNQQMDIMPFIEETKTNIGKRLALEIAPGKKSNKNAEKEYYQLMIKDPTVYSDTISQLSLILDGKYFDVEAYEKLSEEGKKKYLKKFPNASAFADIESTDAQEYTTVREYLTSNKDFGKIGLTDAEIEKIIELEEKDTPLTSEEYSYLKDKLSKYLFAPQKPVYSGQIYDAQTESMRVVYIKSSAFPLSRILTETFPEANNLRLLINKLEDNLGLPVRVSYSTANKLGSVAKPFNIYDANNKIRDVDEMITEINDINENNKPYLKLERANLRMQQEIPVKDKNVIGDGTQQRKLLWLNVLGINSEIDEMAKEYMDTYELLYAKNLRRLYKQLKLDVKKPLSQQKIDKKVLSKLLLEEARTKSLQDKKGLVINKFTNDFELPLWLHPSSDVYENLLNSIINNRVLKIMFTGKTYVLGSPQGFETSVQEIDNFNLPENVIFTSNYDGKLTNSYFRLKSTKQPITDSIEKYNPDDIEFVPAKVFVSAKITIGKEKINLMDEKYSYVKNGKRYLNEENIDPEVLKLFGFRIPTSGQMSMASMEIAGFLPEAYGDLIIAPKDFLKQMGSDFDVDKLNTYSYELVKDKDGKVKVRTKDNVKTDTNRLLELHFNLLASKNTEVQKQVLNPLGFDVAKSQADLIEANMPTDANNFTSMLDDEYQKYKRSGGSSGKSGTGVYSLAVTGNASLQLANFYGHPFSFNEMVYSDSANGFVPKPLVLDISGMRFNSFFGSKDTLKAKGDNSEKRYISDVLAQRQNYSLDNEKEQLMHRLNDNTFTFSFNMFMDLAGYDLITVKDKNGNNVDISITDFIRTSPPVKYFTDLRQLGYSEADAILKTLELFNGEANNYEFPTANFRNYVASPDFAQKLFDQQVNYEKVFELFLFASEYGGYIRKLFSSLNTDSKYLEVGFSNIIAKKRKIDEIYKSKLYGNINGLLRYTFNGFATKHGLFASKIFTDMYPYESKGFKRILEFIRTEVFNDEVYNFQGTEIKEIFDGLKGFMYSSKIIQHLEENYNISDLRRMFFFDKYENDVLVNESLSSYVRNLKNLNIFKEAFINLLDTSFENNGLPSIITWNNNVKFDNDEKFYYDFLNMFTSDVKLPDYNGIPMTKQKLAQMLVAYSYLEGGIQEASQFIKYVPLEYLTSMGIVNKLKRINFDDLTEIDIQKFVTQYIQHNPLVVKKSFTNYNIFNEDSKVQKPSYDVSDINDLVEFNYLGEDSPLFIRVSNYRSNIENTKIKRKGKTLLFMKVGEGKYVRIPVLGIHGMSEYNFDYSEGIVTKSMINEYNNNTVFTNDRVKDYSESYYNENDFKDLNSILKVIATKGTSPFNRILADFMSTTLFNYIDKINFKIEILDDSTGGAYTVSDNTLRLNAKYIQKVLRENNPIHVEDVLLHELLHALTARTIRNKDKLPEHVKKSIDRLENLLNQAKSQLLTKRDLEILEGIRSKMTKLKANEKVKFTKEEMELYPFFNLDEFIAHASDKDFREKLNKLKLKDSRNIIQRLLDRLKKLIKDLLAIEGFDTDFYNEYLENIMNVVEYQTGTTIQEFEERLSKNTLQEQQLENGIQPASSPEQHTFTYNGITIPTAFKLSEDQDAALKRLIDFVNSDEPRIVLQGAAGTGKTSIIGYLSRYLQEGFLYMAPTHAATAELGFATVPIGNKKLPITVASAFKYDSFTNTYKLSKKARLRVPLGGRIAVVDETSMLNSLDYKKTKDLENEGMKVIYLGDVKQIPEVVKINKDSKEVSKAFTENPKVELNKVHRTSITELKTLLQKIRDQITFKLFKLKNNTDSVKFSKKYIEFEREMVKYFKTDPTNTVYIAYDNKTVSQINKKIREDIFGRRGEVQKDDVIVGYLGYRSKQIDKGNIANSIRYRVNRVVKINKGYIISGISDKLNNLKKLGVTGLYDEYTATYLPLSNNEVFENTFDEETYNKNNAEVSNYFKNLETLRRRAISTNSNRDWAAFLEYSDLTISEYFTNINLGETYIYNFNTDRMEIYNSKSPSPEHRNLEQVYGKDIDRFVVEKGIDYGHAITIHKSQGATIKNVFFDANTLLQLETKLIQDGKQISTEMQSLGYVAMSRASEYLHVYEGWVNFEEIDNDVVESTQPITVQPVVEETIELFDPNLPKVNIYAGTGENAELSNFALRPFTISDSLAEFLYNEHGDYYNQKYKSVEQAYQHIKVSYNKSGYNDSLADDILATTNGRELRILGKKVDLDIQSWDKDSSKIMKELLKTSFEQNPNALAKLLATGNATLTHVGAEKPNKWTKEFPKLLMEVRQELRGKSTQPTTEKTTPSVKKSLNPLLEAGVKSTDMYGNAAKDIEMANESTQFIGFQSGNASVSSTEKYRQAWGANANTGNYSSQDIIMISGSGTFRGVTEEQIKETLTNKYKPLIEKAIKAGASFRVGNRYDKGNLSDELVAKYLQAKGYVEEKLNGYSRWSPPTQPATQPQAVTQPQTTEAQVVTITINGQSANFTVKGNNVYDKNGVKLNPEYAEELITRILEKARSDKNYSIVSVEGLPEIVVDLRQPSRCQ